METNENLLNSELQIDATGHAHLAETTKWALFLSIVGFIFSGIIAILSFFIAAKLQESSRYGDPTFSPGTVIAIYLIIAVIWFFASLYLNRFATKMKVALMSADQDALNNSFLNLKNLYKLMGILTIIYLSLLILAILLGIGSSFMNS